MHSTAFTVFLNALLLCCWWQVPNLCAGHRAHCTALAGQAATTPEHCVQHGWTAAAQPSRHGGSGKCERVTQQMLARPLGLPNAATLRLQPHYRQLSNQPTLRHAVQPNTLLVSTICLLRCAQVAEVRGYGAENIVAAPSASVQRWGSVSCSLSTFAQNIGTCTAACSSSAVQHWHTSGLGLKCKSFCLVFPFAALRACAGQSPAQPTSACR